MIPKVKIVYSEIYEGLISRTRWDSYNEKRRVKAERLASQLQKEWDKNDRKILRLMSAFTGLEWHDKDIDCYLSYGIPYSISHPLTLWIGREKEAMIVTMVHELSHVLFWSNRNHVRWPPPVQEDSGIYKRYRKDEYNTKLHLPVEALVILVIKAVFGGKAEKYLKEERFWKRYRNEPMSKDYKRAWEIVEAEGPENVIKSIITKSSRRV